MNQRATKLHSCTPRPSGPNPHFRFAMAASDPLAGRFPAAVASAAGDLLASGEDCRPGLAACQAWDGVKVVLGLAWARAGPDRLQISCNSPKGRNCDLKLVPKSRSAQFHYQFYRIANVKSELPVPAPVYAFPTIVSSLFGTIISR